MTKKTREEKIEAIVATVDDMELDDLISMLKDIRRRELNEASDEVIDEWYSEFGCDLDDEE